MPSRLSPLLALLALAAPALAQLPPPPPPPPGNPLNPDKINLGKVLFWDEQLSSTNTVACGTCHIPASGGSDPRSLLPGAVHPGLDLAFGTPDDVIGSPGVIQSDATGLYTNSAEFGLRPQATPRKTPSMINSAYVPEHFWDGRAGPVFDDPVSGAPLLPFGAALENQSAGPPLNDVEMAHTGRLWTDVETRVAGATPLVLASAVPPALSAWIAGRPYGDLFTAAFGTPGVSAARIAMALATYQRTLISDQSPFDAGALTPQQLNGLNIFNGPGRCNLCHVGPLFTDHTFRNIGVRPTVEDEGRFDVTGNPADRGRFKMPSLRNVALRAPYFHNGGMPTLMDVVDFYDRGGDFGFNQDPAIIPLGLAPPMKADLVAFLQALTDPRVAAETAPFDRPLLSSETPGMRPQVFGASGPGSGGLAPVAVAVEPPFIGNANMTFGMENGMGGMPVTLGLDVLSSPPGTVVKGAPFHLGFSAAMFFLPLGALPGAAPGEGFVSLSLGIPFDPTLIGFNLVTQWFVSDPGAPLGLATSPGVRHVFF